MLLRLLSILAALTLAGCQHARPPASVATSVEQRAPVTILVSIDGFRPDYLDRGVTPTLSRLAAEGVRASMRPSFPSKTFPNHWTLVTGLVPDRHGIVANRMEDARRPGETFTMASDDPFWWNEAEPIWVSAERAGIRTATMFWPGSNVAWGGELTKQWPKPLVGGERPHDWQQFNQQVSPQQRIDAVLDWLRRPTNTRPKFVTLYFDEVDSAGHAYGPDDPRTTKAVELMDRYITALVAGLRELGQPANLVFTADHGMAATSSERVVRIDSLADPADYRLVEAGPYAALDAVPGREAALEARLLKPHAHATCWRKAEIPARFRYGRHPRVPPYLCLAETGWELVDKPPSAPRTGGNHGFDHEAPEMAALFLAHGPAFRRGSRLAPFDSVAVYPLLRTLIGLPPVAGKDGDPAAVADALAR
jgi:predicted AlkP superfamily pyrophosphatase or phosphodiesterase